jgi:RNA polymerase sigma factor (sigma-70 family)
MSTNEITLSSDTIDLSSEATWNDLYSSLRSLVRYLVYSFTVSSWRGQQEDIIEDIIQETMRRVLERARKAERGEADPIHSLKQMMTVIAQNYCKDLWRRDHKVSHMPSQGVVAETFVGANEQTHTLDTVTENVYQEFIFMAVAHEIANFPDKQRKAILIDLANRMCFDIRPTPLQKAFLKEGIQLKYYQQPLPTDPRERSRHLSILNYAYQRIARSPRVHEYTSVV